MSSQFPTLCFPVTLVQQQPANRGSQRHVLVFFHYSGRHLSCVGAQQGLDKALFHEAKQKWKRRWHFSVETTAHSILYFHLGQQQPAPLRSTGSLWSKWFSPAIHCNCREKHFWGNWWEDQLIFNSKKFDLCGLVEYNRLFFLWPSNKPAWKWFVVWKIILEKHPLLS